MWFRCDGLGWGGWAGGIVGWAIFVGTLILVGIGVVWLARQLRRAPLATHERADPLEIARRRLAAGEITIDEFEAIRGRLAT
jgi:putative membrane protein